MNQHTVSIALLLLCFLNTCISATDIPTCITGDVSINSGSVDTSSAPNGREWVGDVKPKLPSFLQLKGSSTTSTAIHKLISADPVPHDTARISLSQFSYAFLLNPGQKIIRLHFNPSPYRGFKGLRDLFTVEAGAFTLLSNFSASLTADVLGLKSFAKEFCLNIRENEQLILTFSPATSPSRDSTYAFINGIEIISVPAGLSYFDGRDNRNPSVLSAGDFDGVFPTWAIENANKSRNDTWKVPVDVGFRLIDIAKESVENSIPRYMDYMVMMRGHKREVAEIWEAGSSEEKNKPSARAERLCRRFSLAEIRLATRNFSDALFIGRGGFGKVYKGLIDKGQTIVAVKRLKSNSRQGAHEFLMEIETLSELRHVNLVSLIGYCNEHGEMILVYDYMAGGTLSDHLYKLQRKSNDCPPLTWKQRLNICIGAGRGLDYLHTGHGIIQFFKHLAR
ncbi:UNVERIFIED_CONTAM: putative receptor-like protein kinase [Sesamum radiatum]|uniref:Receptor-like protein kinase n=1 Tax=Sesamum radiatum TaxID=300843 RepID=A0AAW2P617_SESRA